MVKKKNKPISKSSKRKDFKNSQGVLGVILSILGVLLAFQYGTNDLKLYLLFLAMVIIGILLVTKSLSD